MFVILETDILTLVEGEVHVLPDNSDNESDSDDEEKQIDKQTVNSRNDEDSSFTPTNQT